VKNINILKCNSLAGTSRNSAKSVTHAVIKKNGIFLIVYFSNVNYLSAFNSRPYWSIHDMTISVGFKESMNLKVIHIWCSGTFNNSSYLQNICWRHQPIRDRELDIVTGMVTLICIMINYWTGRSFISSNRFLEMSSFL